MSTNGSYLLELSPSDLSVLRTKRLGMGRAHELDAAGPYVYVHVDGDGHRVLKIDPSSLSVVASTPSLNATKSPEGFVFLSGAMFVAVGGPPGKIVKIDQSSMAILGEWRLPGGIENHNFTTDGVNLFVLGVPTRWGTPNKYYKLSPALELLGTLTFSRNGTLGGNVYFPGTRSVYTSPAGIFRIDPQSFTVQASSAHSGRGRLHWLAKDSRWIYSLDSAMVKVWDPATLTRACARKTTQSLIHYGIVQDGYLWTASETVPGTVGRYELFPAGGNQPATAAVTRPAAGASFAVGTTIVIKGSASDPDGRITRVQFYDGTKLLGSDDVSPYGYNWSNAAAGTHTLTAKAIDDCGVTTTSQPTTITVGAGGTGGMTGTRDFPAEADVYVDERFPGNNFGTSANLAVGGGNSRREMFIRFNVAGLPAGARVTDARLSVMANNASRDAGGGGTIRAFAAATPQWTEGQPTWSSPLAGSDGSGNLFTLGPVVAGSRYTFSNLASAIPGNGRVTFVVRSSVEDGAQYYSRSASSTTQRPSLRVIYTTAP